MTTDSPAAYGPAIVRGLVSLVIVLALMIVLCFWPAGDWGWPRGWAMLGLFIALIIASMIYMSRVNPEIFVARSKATGAGTKGWDYAILVVVLSCFMAILPLGGFDYRFGWAQTPAWVVWLGYLLLVAGFVVTAWAQGVNRHFEPSVRIQSDRGHTVIDTGPYAIIRHPGYIAGTVMAAGMALGLGSWVAMIPVVILAVALVYRTLREEETLVAELPGYAEFRTRTRWRWIPGLW
jgi:protein-S-isoprenylcysteine O-methyltransferase Ste14